MDDRMNRFVAGSCLLSLLGVVGSAGVAAAAARFELEKDAENGALRVKLDGKEAFVYQHGPNLDLPHYHPLNTPSGKNLLIQKTEPYPHHRAFWIADTVERGGTSASLYNAYYTGVKRGKNDHTAPFKTRIRHDGFLRTEATSDSAIIEDRLVWETTRDNEPYPLLDEHRTLKLTAMPDGGYLMDLSFTLTAPYGDVTFISDDVHYAWPYLRLNPDFSGDQGGVITADSGATGQEDTNLKPAKWIDYSNAVDGTTEGIAMFQQPDGKDRRWLTRKYGTFGPRRLEEQSGKPFVLKKGESLSQRAGVLVHAGDVESGRVAEVYDLFVSGGSAAAASSTPASSAAGLELLDNSSSGILTVRDGGTTNVLSYRYGDQLQEGVHRKYTRSCYIHPLYSLDGEPLTDDFPADHFHHRGIFWTWPVVETRGLKTSTWEPGTPPLHQKFVRWAKKEAGKESAVVAAENVWVLDGKEEVARELVTVTVHPAEGQSRAVDIEIRLEAVGGPLGLRGQPQDDKGYGGLCLRAAPRFKGVPLTTDKGPVKGDAVAETHRWADLSDDKGGVALFVPPDHPDAPLPWLVRNSYAGFINPSWPGGRTVVLNPGQPVTLRNRIYIHRGDVESGQVGKAYEEYAAGVSARQ